MTDFIDSLLSSMSSKFNEQKDVGTINLNEDKTLKWRGLHNNQYASVKKRKKALAMATATTTRETDTPENGNRAVGNDNPNEKITVKEHTNEIDDDANEQKPNRRILRRKLMDDIHDDGNKRGGRANRKRPVSTDSASSNAMDKIGGESTATIDAKVAERRSIRIRKTANNTDVGVQGEAAAVAAVATSTTTSATIAVADAKTITKTKLNDHIKLENESTESQQHVPRLRRSERTLHGTTTPIDTKDISLALASDAIVDGEQSTAAETEASTSTSVDSLKKIRKRNAEDRKLNNSNIETVSIASSTDVIILDDAQDDKKDVLLDKATYDCDSNESVLHANDLTTNDEKSLDASNVTDENQQIKIVDDTDNDVIILDAEPIGVGSGGGSGGDVSGAVTMKKRGRRPAAKLLPKIDVNLEQPQIATRSSRVKKSPKLNSDEADFSYSLSKKDKAINEQVNDESFLFLFIDRIFLL